MRIRRTRKLEDRSQSGICSSGHPSLDTSQYVIGPDDSLTQRVREILLEKHYSRMSWWKPEYATELPERYEQNVQAHSYRRYNTCLEHIVPWMADSVDLAGADVVELGCGTGSSTAAIARFARHVYAYDIARDAVAAARLRCEALEIHNVTISSCRAEQMSSAIRTHNKIDVFLLYAVLEHQTVAERLETLSLAWETLRPGGVLVIVETPNRLTYMDVHTSKLPFFHMLPLELQVEYAHRSPRVDFRENIAHHSSHSSPESLHELLIRWGQSVSYHELELSLDVDLADVLVSDGYHPLMLTHRPIRPEESALLGYVETTNLRIPRGLTRYYLDLILKKP